MEYKKIMVTIIEYEKQYDMNNKTIAGVPFWGEIRRYILFNYQDKNFMKKANNIKVETMKNLFINKFSSLNEHENVIFVGHRKQLVKGKFIDSLSNDILTKFPNSICVETNTFDGKIQHVTDAKSVSTLELKILRKNKKIKLNKDDFLLLSHINNFFNKKFNKNFKIEKMIEIVENLIFDVNYYELNFRRINPRKIFFTMSYTNTAPVIAANKLKINTFEIQYSAIMKYHIGYYHPNEKKLSYYPETILVWGDYWKKDYLPSDINKLCFNKRLLVNQTVKKNKIVLISQDVVSEKILKFSEILSESKLLESFEIVLKQHPWEKVVTSKKFKVYDSFSKIPVEEVIKDAICVITVFSSVIYQADELGCGIFILKDDLNELLDDLDKMYVGNSAEDVFEFVNKPHKKLFDSYGYIEEL